VPGSAGDGILGPPAQGREPGLHYSACSGWLWNVARRTREGEESFRLVSRTSVRIARFLRVWIICNVWHAVNEQSQRQCDQHIAAMFWVAVLLVQPLRAVRARVFASGCW
jgi:hypothetical protein